MAILVTMPSIQCHAIIHYDNTSKNYFYLFFFKLMTIQICSKLKYFLCRLPSLDEYNLKLSHIFHSYASFKTFEKAATPNSTDGSHSAHDIFYDLSTSLDP